MTNSMGLPGGSMVKNLPANVGDEGRCRFNSWVVKKPWDGNGHPFQYFCLENPSDRRAGQATVHRVETEHT